MSALPRQHYVPQFLLRHFSVSAALSQVWAYDKRTGARRIHAIRDSAQEKQFYEHDELRQRGVDLETDLADLESHAAPVIARCVQQRSLRTVGTIERATILDFALVQLFRTKAARELAKIGSEQVLARQITDKNAQEMSLAVLIRDFPRYRACCESHIITLRETRMGERFLLGDGVTLIAAATPSDSLRAAFETAVVIVPVCPTLCIMLFPTGHQSDLLAAGTWYRPDTRILDEVQPTAPGDVDSINAMSVLLSNRFVFSSTDGFGDIDLLLKLNPVAKTRPVGGHEPIRWSSDD